MRSKDQSSIVVVSSLHSRKAFDIANSLKRNGCVVVGVVPNFGIIDRLLPFVYKIKIYEYDTADALCSTLVDIANQNGGLVFIPVEEVDVEFIHSYQNELSRNRCVFLNPSEKSFRIAKDKSSFLNHCKSIGISIPEPIELLSGDLNCAEFKYPIIVKPKIGAGARGVKRIDSFDQLKQEIDFNDCENLLAQEYIDSQHGVEGAFFVASHGKILGQYTHKRLLTYPKNGGVSVISVSGQNLEILSLGSKILESLNWSGFAMIEFILDRRDGKYKVIEMNPRTWGSIILGETTNRLISEAYVEGAKGTCNRLARKNEENTIVFWLFPWFLVRFIQSPILVWRVLKTIRGPRIFVNMTNCNIERSTGFHVYLIIKMIANSLKRLHRKSNF